MELIKWKIDINPLTRTVTIKEDTVNQRPIAQIATPYCDGNWMDNQQWLSSAIEKANFVASTPILLHALEVALFAIDVEDEAYQVVQNAIKLAKGGK